MTSAIRTITMPFMLNVTVNCYLVRAGDGFILIDTGRFSKRRFVEDELEQAGCQPGKLRLIVLTHGDFDHCGNAAYLRTEFGSRTIPAWSNTGICSGIANRRTGSSES